MQGVREKTSQGDMDTQKVLLDELMGKDRDLPLNQQQKYSKPRLQFDDPQVCHYHLVAFCPHDLFPNTKYDLGACAKLHDDALRADFHKSNSTVVTRYEAEFLDYLERLISDVERKIKGCRKRLNKEMPRANSDRKSAIAVEVQSLLAQAEKEGDDGQVDQAQATMSKVEVLTKEKDKLTVSAVMPEHFGRLILEKEKRMQVCEVCGAMQAATDTEKRLDSHLEGKKHLGYLRIRQTAVELRKKREEDLRESRRRDRETVEKPLKKDGKFKVESEVIMEGSKDSEKNGSRHYNRSRPLTPACVTEVGRLHPIFSDNGRRKRPGSVVARPDTRERYVRRERSRSKEKLYRRRISRSPERVWDREPDKGIKDWEKNWYQERDRDRNCDHNGSRDRDRERDRDGRKDSGRGRGRDHERTRDSRGGRR